MSTNTNYAVERLTMISVKYGRTAVQEGRVDADLLNSSVVLASKIKRALAEAESALNYVPESHPLWTALKALDNP